MTDAFTKRKRRRPTPDRDGRISNPSLRKKADDVRPRAANSTPASHCPAFTSKVSGSAGSVRECIREEVVVEKRRPPLLWTGLSGNIAAATTTKPMQATCHSTVRLKRLEGVPNAGC